MIKLVTIPLSHYCERARWALDLAQVDYTEQQVLQRFSNIVARQLGGRKTLPVMIANGRVLNDSTDIVKWCSMTGRAKLYPEPNKRPAVEAFEAELAGDFGVETRRLAYVWFFDNLNRLIRYNTAAAPRHQEMLLRMAKGFLVPKMRVYLGLTESNLSRGRDLVERTLERVAAQLSDGRRYLFGDQFSAADLTFASLGSILVLPRQYGMPLPDIDVVADPATRSWIEELRQHPAGQFILRLYAERPLPRGKLERPLRVPRPAA